MKAIATHRNARISARKVRLYRGLLRGRAVAEADSQLLFMPGKSPRLVLAVLRSAVANATTNFKLDKAKLVISDVIVDGGFVFKRMRPRSKGSGYPILKRTAHVTVVVEDPAVTPRVKPAGKKVAQPIQQDSTHVKTESHGVPSTPQQTRRQRDAKSLEAMGAQRRRGAAGAMQKIKMMQQGGDVHKTSRRKSPGK